MKNHEMRQPGNMPEVESNEELIKKHQTLVNYMLEQIKDGGRGPVLQEVQVLANIEKYAQQEEYASLKAKEIIDYDFKNELREDFDKIEEIKAQIIKKLDKYRELQEKLVEILNTKK